MVPIALAPLLLSLTAFTDGDLGRTPAHPAREAFSIAEVEGRAAALERDLSASADFYASEVEPIARILRPLNPDERWVLSVAVSLVRQGHRVGVDPRVLAAVVLVENPWLDPKIASSQGAIGLMQVMPFHAGRWDCDSSDLTDPDVNVCHGARIFAFYLTRAEGDIDKALLAYNGGVTGLNTPDCSAYPSHVYSNAGRAAVRAWLGE